VCVHACVHAVLEIFVFLVTVSLQNVLHMIFLSVASYKCKINGKILARLCSFCTWQRNFVL